MSNSRILASWIGHADIKAMAATLSKSQKTKVLKALKLEETKPIDSEGPIKTLLEKEKFREIHLLSNYPSSITKLIKTWIGANTQIHEISLKDPTNYPDVFKIVNSTLAEVVGSKGEHQNIELCIHLSPGTPTMTAIWVLLGKTRYPATFYQTYKGKSWKTDVPFDLMLDYIPEVLSEPDKHLQHLASMKPQDIEGFEEITGNSKAIRIAVGRANKAAVRDVPILILGESGVGKELFARAIHTASHRKDKPFVVLNCAAVPKDLLESELFGHKKGAFTGAITDRSGALETANGGTLFLDEVGECELATQVKLLRILQPPLGKGPCYKIFRRLGDDKDRTVDVRIIAATNRDLQEAIRDGFFREDLYYRIAVITINIPPLRERKQDITMIAETLLKQINEMFRLKEPGYKDKYFSENTNSFVKTLPWPGNVRQLFNVLLQAAVMSGEDCLKNNDIRQALGESIAINKADVMGHPLGGDFALEELLNSIQKHYLQRAMEEANSVKTKAAELLGMKNYQTLDAQLKRFRISEKK